MGWLNRRIREAEWMDQPDIDPHLHTQALQSLARINVLSATQRSFYSRLLRFQRENHLAKLRILDVASGGGDVTMGLWRRAARYGLDWRLTGWDMSQTAVDHARNQAMNAGLLVHFACKDVLEHPVDSGFDAIICSLFLHHLEEGDVVRLLQNLAGNDVNHPRLILINDLNRSTMGFLLAQAACRLLSRSPVVRVDGPR
ncbi:MAG: methyltransferase domain-containing protein, partial [Gemmataceae bacterium]